LGSCPTWTRRCMPYHLRGSVQLFRSTLIDEAELGKKLRKSVLWEKLNRYNNAGDGYVGRPPRPLHAGYLGLLLASGHLDGVVDEGEERHVVRGKVEKLTLTYQVSIKALRRDGEIITLM